MTGNDVEEIALDLFEESKEHKKLLRFQQIDFPAPSGAFLFTEVRSTKKLYKTTLFAPYEHYMTPKKYIGSSIVETMHIANKRYEEGYEKIIYWYDGIL